MKNLQYFIFALGVLFSSCMSDKPVNDNSSKNKERIQEFYDKLVNAHNENMVDSFFTNDFVDHQYDPDNSKQSIEDVKSDFKEFFTSIPDGHLRVNFMLANDDTVMANVTMTGTNTGPINGKPATNKSINIDGVAIFILKENKIAQRWRFFNDVLKMQQLGFMPNPEVDSTHAEKMGKK